MSQQAELAAIRTFLTTVRAVDDVHPHLRRITFAGGDLTTFDPGGPDAFLYVLLPPPGRDRLTIDQTFTWEGYQQMPEADRPVGSYYTLRSWRPEQAELDVLFVLHGDTGPASAWASRARPGDPVALWGPRTAWDPPVGTDRYVLVADETGLPAVAAILEALPHDSAVQVIAEVAEPAEEHPMPRTGPGVAFTWLHRDGAAPGTTTLLADAVRALDVSVTTYAWGGGESHAMTAARKHLRHSIGLRREQVTMVAYWRHADHEPDLDDD